jgi:hypothetical protein
LAKTLSNLGIQLGGLGQQQAALEATREAVSILSALVQRQGGTGYTNGLQWAVAQLHAFLLAAGVDPDVDPIHTEASRVLACIAT